VKILLDSSVLIDVLRRRNGRREALAALVRAHESLATTSLNIAELYAGMRPGEEASTEALLDGLECFDLTGSAARLGGKLKNHYSKRGQTLSLADALIAAIAIEERCALLTDNRKDFPMPELQLYSWA
jgi:predicted nucleic acid-binding protein